MSSTTEAQESSFPVLPAKHHDFIQYVSQNTEKSLLEVLQPYKQYDAELRKAFAQQPDHPKLKEPNVLSVFEGHQDNLKIRARNVDAESDKIKESYIMPLKQEERRTDGSSAIVDTFTQFKEQFSLFSESALADMDWSNVVAAGSSVVTPLLPVPEKYAGSKRAMRQYYHEVFAPASDIDLFLYGLNEEQAIDKIRQIEQKVKDALLVETTTIRTKNAITIASQYPVRHVQIVLRMYKSISEILTGFDVDCSCAAFDGQRVWTNPRALVSYMTQVNVIDLTRRSPSYENRLSKYRHRGFEVCWPDLDRSRIDPTIYERSFLRTEGLARLLVLEKLPTTDAREAYLDQRRAERGRPAANRSRRKVQKLVGDIKAQHDDEIAEWVDDEDVSSYHTFTVPYGPKYHAAKIEKLLYTKDLLLNAEWNKPEDREVHLHRHPAFFGSVNDIIHDFCGDCPQPTTMEEEEVCDTESKIYVSGDITFIKDDPGRQTIGSFNPITADDYTEMAYVGNSEMLCRAIVDGDVDFVESWLRQDGNDPNTRDFTGRTPLHLAVMQSTAQIVQILIDNGARLIARLVDGRTALHIACMRGDIDMVKALLTKSVANEEEEDERLEARREAHRAKKVAPTTQDSGEDSDIDMIDDNQTDIDATTENSIVNIKSPTPENVDKALDDEDKDDPDVYNVNVVAWDTAVAPLHLAIVKGHVDIVKCLVQDFGADILLPVKLFFEHSPSTPRAALLTLILALELPHEKAEEMTRTLFALGATCSQADLHNKTALHTCVTRAPDMLELYQEVDAIGVQRAINHCSNSSDRASPIVKSALISAIEARDSLTALRLMNLGAKANVSYASYLKASQTAGPGYGQYWITTYQNQYETQFDQPIMLAVKYELPEVALHMIKDHNIDVNSYSTRGREVLSGKTYLPRDARGTTLLDHVREKLNELLAWTPEDRIKEPPKPLKQDSEYLDEFQHNTYRRWSAERQLSAAKRTYKIQWDPYVEAKKRSQERQGLEEKQAAIFDAIEKYRQLQSVMISRGAKGFYELHPDLKEPAERDNHHSLGHYFNFDMPFEKVIFGFKAERGISDDKHVRYADLFDAVWLGDEVAVKRHVLLPSKDAEGQEQSPLQIAVQDNANLSPFAIAVLRGHQELALTILELAEAQYQVKGDTIRRQTRLRGEGDDGCSDHEDSSSDVELETEDIHDKFTIENVGEVAVEVKSYTSPVTMLKWQSSACKEFNPSRSTEGKSGSDMQKHTSRTRNQPDANEGAPGAGLHSPSTLIEWSIWHSDAQCLSFLLDAMHKYRFSNSDEDSEDTRPDSNMLTEILYAISANDIPMLSTLIKGSGAGIPLQHFAKNSGVEMTETSKYYQGLTVHGKKKKEWAMRGRNQSRNNNHDFTRPPLLESARHAVLETFEWYLSDAPLRCYAHYARTHPEDKRWQQVAKSKAGVEGMLRPFFSLRTELAIHCCLLASKSKNCLEMLSYLIYKMPDSINLRSEQGITPLHIAFKLRRVEEARLLIEAGADQTIRDKVGRNILHMLFMDGAHEDKAKEELLAIKSMLDLVDKRLIKSLCEERSAAANGTQTPLTQWLSNISEQEFELDVCRLLVETSRGVELDLVDGQGHTPLHIAVSRSSFYVCKLIADHSPRLINRENATGRTPYEAMEDRFLASQFQSQSGSHTSRRWHTSAPNNSDLVNRDSKEFLEKPTISETSPRRIWELMQDTRAKLEAEGCCQRILVTLNEANEVARRLSAMHAKKSLSYRQARNERQDAFFKGDEVHAWLMLPGF